MLGQKRVGHLMKLIYLDSPVLLAYRIDEIGIA